MIHPTVDPSAKNSKPNSREPHANTPKSSSIQSSSSSSETTTTTISSPSDTTTRTNGTQTSITKSTTFSSLKRPQKNTSTPTLILTRTAERVDRIFPQWIQENFTQNGNYVIQNLNLPLRLPQRKGNIQAFAKDTPITEFGKITSQLTGRGLQFTRYTPDKVFSSPALRCIQTAAYILRALENQSLKICIEPGLFELAKWQPPEFMTTEELIKAGLPIDQKYEPHLTAKELKGMMIESIEAVYNRTKSTLNAILNNFPGQSILVVGHALTMDAGARGLLGEKSGMGMKETELGMIGLQYPYNSTLMLKENERMKKWNLEDQTLPPVSYLDTTNIPNVSFLSRA